MRRSLALFVVIAMGLLVLEDGARARVVFMDRFEYAVSRSDPNAVQLFVQNGWWHAKTMQSSPGAHGYLYTVTSVPGHNGPLPGTGSSRALALEAVPSLYPIDGITQTDFYLQYGDGGSAAANNAIPGDVWFQFWLYPVHSGSQTSRFSTREKFMYVCNADYPCHSHKWMVMSGSVTYNPNNMFPLGNPSEGQFLWAVRNAAGVSQINNTTGDRDSPSNIGSPNPTEWVRPNRWTLVKMHFRTTSTTGNSWEAWLRPLGGGWVKVSEWIGGVTPGFTWNIPAEHVGGHRVLRMPTNDTYDYMLYMDDFVMATAESDLPVYSDGGATGTTGTGSAPQAPTNLRIIAALFDRAVAFLRNAS